MASLTHRMKHMGNAIGVWIHRTFKGRFDSGRGDVRLARVGIQSHVPSEGTRGGDVGTESPGLDTCGMIVA